MSETKHTALPWRKYLAGSEGVRIMPDTDDIRERHKLIGMVNGRDLLTDQANAHLIVTAVNFHERLVESLSELSAVIAHFQAGNAHLSQADERVSRAEALISEIDFLSEISKAAE